MYFIVKKRICEPCGKYCSKCSPDRPDSCLICLNPDTELDDHGRCVPKKGKYEDNSGDIKSCD